LVSKATSSSPNTARRSALRARRVIDQTIRQKLPEGFQSAEFLLEHGQVDMVVRRNELKSALGRVLRFLMTKPVPA